jgi:hypothetical protein
MRWIATLLSVVFLSNCTDTSYAYRDFDESYNRALNDSACQPYNHDFRFCH